LEASHPGRQPKYGLYKKIQYIHWLIEECILICSSVNQEIYVTRGRGAGQGRTPRIFISDMEAYICRFYVTDEYIIIFLKNIIYYIHRRYVPP
jgi:hypothetical protein